MNVCVWRLSATVSGESDKAHEPNRAPVTGIADAGWKRLDEEGGETEWEVDFGATKKV